MGVSTGTRCQVWTIVFSICCLKIVRLFVWVSILYVLWYSFSGAVLRNFWKLTCVLNPLFQNLCQGAEDGLAKLFRLFSRLFRVSQQQNSDWVAHNFIWFQSFDPDYGNHVFGELSSFDYCLTRKIKASHSLPLLEEWEEYIVPYQSNLPAVEEENFMTCIRVPIVVDNFGSYYWKS